MRRPTRFVLLLLSLGLAFVASSPGFAASQPSFLRSLAASPTLSAVTVPANGDQNPYGVAVIPSGFPGFVARPGDILVSDFNDVANAQGTGRTIVDVSPAGAVKPFFTAPSSLGPIGLTTALAVLPEGIVIVGNTPAPDGTAESGSLIFLDAYGRLLLNLTHPLLQGPWDMTVDAPYPDRAVLYVSNVLTGTVTRVNLHLTTRGVQTVPVIDQLTQVASGFAHRTDPAALVVGPTGLLLTPDRSSLYVADTGNNRIQLVTGVRDTQTDVGAGQTIFSGAPLRGPLALARSPEGTIVASNGDAAGSTSTPPNLVVEIDPTQREVVATRQLDSDAPGGIFGIAVGTLRMRTGLFYVDDNTNTLNFLPSAGG